MSVSTYTYCGPALVVPRTFDYGDEEVQVCPKCHQQKNQWKIGDFCPTCGSRLEVTTVRSKNKKWSVTHNDIVNAFEDAALGEDDLSLTDYEAQDESVHLIYTDNMGESNKPRMLEWRPEEDIICVITPDMIPAEIAWFEGAYAKHIEVTRRLAPTSAVQWIVTSWWS